MQYKICCLFVKMPCNSYYVGKKRELKTKICEHKCSIHNHDDKSSMARHFNSHNHSLCDLHYMAIETVNMPQRGGNRDRILQQRETYWIHSLNTLISNGLNEEISFSRFLWTEYNSLWFALCQESSSWMRWFYLLVSYELNRTRFCFLFIIVFL